MGELTSVESRQSIRALGRNVEVGERHRRLQPPFALPPPLLDVLDCLWRDHVEPQLERTPRLDREKGALPI